MRTLLQGIAAVMVGAALVAGCADAPEPPPPTIAAVTIAADPGLNPSPDGRPSPAVVRLFHLTGSAQFELADFFQLMDDPQGTLKADLVSVQEVVMTPGATQSLQIELEPTARFLGAIVAYRALDQANWRAVVEVPPNQTTPIAVGLQPLSVEMQAPPPPQEEG
jgi:type VI secretion system protein VasD